MKNALFAAAILIVVYLLFIYIKFRGDLAKARELIARAVPYEQHLANPDRRVLFLGDSTAAGTGTSDNKFSTPGRFGMKYSDSDITNLGKNGARIADVIVQSGEAKGQKFDLVISQAGGNDILHFTPLSEVESGLDELVDNLKTISNKVILIHGGNMGASPAFPFGTKALFSWRTRKVREIFIKIANEKGVRYIDLYTPLKDFPQTRNGSPTSAPDGFHPSDEGYAIWFEHIVGELE